MGASKTTHFSASHNEIAALAKALAHPARIAILEYLMSVNTCICGDIVNVLPLAQPTVSQHLKELKQVGLIKGNIEGNAICYCIDTEKWAACQALFAAFFDKKNTGNSTCC